MPSGRPTQTPPTCRSSSPSAQASRPPQEVPVFQAIPAGIIPEAAVLGGLAELCAAPPPRPDEAITVFKTVGFAALDLIATELALEGLALTAAPTSA